MGWRFSCSCFFDIAVLNKYSQHPKYELELFSETYGTIRNDSESWGIQFGINKAKKVILWLGDISKLPETEIHYLRSENIESDHDIHSEFYDAQITIIPSAISKLGALVEKRNTLIEQVKKEYDFSLYILDGEISETLKNLEKPVFWEEKHISPVIESLNRIFVESLNSSQIKTELLKIDSNSDIKSKGGLKVFQMWLESFVNEDEAKKIMCPFFVLYDFRVISSHLFSKEKRTKILSSIKSRLELESKDDFEVIYESLLSALSESYPQLLNTIKANE